MRIIFGRNQHEQHRSFAETDRRKQKNRVLRGPGYASPVKYWMPVKGGIGIHDARWRKEFGGDIYLTDGSHGCINMPPSKAKELYNMLSIGDRVVLHN